MDLLQSSTSAITHGNKFYRQRFLLISFFYLLIAGLLALWVRYGVMDEDFHLEAIRPYVNSGVNWATLYHHIPPTGVASHLWFALWMWLFPGINYIGLRLITCAVLLLLAGFTYVQLKTVSTASQQKTLAVSWFMLVSPYFFLSIATVMTEGPALLFLFAGVLLLVVSRLQRLLPFFLACLMLGLATIARFYYISLLPALFVVLLVADWQQYIQHGFQRVTVRRVLPYLFIIIALLPLVGLITLWGGLTPPDFEQWSKLRSGVSFNAFRPLSAVALTGAYVAPFILLNVAWTPKLLRRIIGLTLPVALLLALFRVNLFHDSLSVNDVFSGPIEHSLAWMQARGNLAFSLSLFIVYSLCLVSLTILIQRIIYDVQANGFADKGLVYSVVFVIFFIGSQAFVGGNHPFFDRYLIHPWPFLGYIIVTLFPKFLNPRTYLIHAVYTILAVLVLIKWG